MSKSMLFDTKLHDYYQRRAMMKRNEESDFFLRYSQKEFAERFDFVARKFYHGIDLFGYNGLWGAIAQQSLGVQKITQLHNNPMFANPMLSFYSMDRDRLANFFADDVEEKLGADIDLILCPLMLHFVNDLPNLLQKIRMALKKDGLLLACLPAAGTLKELRSAMLYAEETLYQKVHMRISHFLDIEQAGHLLQEAGFALPVIEKQDLLFRYQDSFALMADLRAMGMQNILVERSKKPVSKRFFNLVDQYYKAHFSDSDGRIRASFSLLWLSGWAPDESQSKALTPGSASHSLAEYLKTIATKD